MFNHMQHSIYYDHKVPYIIMTAYYYTLILLWLHVATPSAGYVDNGVFWEILPLGLKGRFYASVSFRPKGEILRHARRFVHNGDILR